MKQTTMFEVANHDGNASVRLSRRSDPSTSKEAAAKVRVAPNELLFLQVLAKNRHTTMTAKEVGNQSYQYHAGETWDATNSKRETVRKRASGLRDKGLIVYTARRPCKSTGNPSTTYQITKLGLEAIK